jgi:diguanylate cyclase (GGDEF)-like protein/PAS domain S-box-containing protein
VTKLKRSEEKFVLLFENAPIGMAMICHDTGEFLEVNKALLSYLGYTKDEFLTLSFWDITPREYDSQEQSQMDELNQTGKFGPNEKEYIRKDGKRVPIRLSGFKMIDVDKRDVVWGVIENITLERQLKEQHNKVKRLSVTDYLTGLSNRQKLDEALDHEINCATRYTSSFSTIMLDLDYFKKINDTYGHQVGDGVLIEVSAILQQYTRKTDIVGRWGGEEFMIICPEIDGQDGEKLAEKIRAKIERYSFKVIGNITASLGVSIYKQSDQDKSVVERADKALYQAKEQGRNRVVIL